MVVPPYYDAGNPLAVPGSTAQPQGPLSHLESHLKMHVAFQGWPFSQKKTPATRLTPATRFVKSRGLVRQKTLAQQQGGSNPG